MLSRIGHRSGFQPWFHYVNSFKPSSLTIKEEEHLEILKLQTLRPDDGLLVVKIYVNDEEKNCPHELSELEISPVTLNAVSLISRLLEKIPEHRIVLSDVIGHDWFKSARSVRNRNLLFGIRGFNLTPV